MLVLVSAGNSNVNNFFTSIILTPVQQVATEGINTAGDALNPGKSKQELEHQVSRLEEENRKLNEKLVEYYDLKKQNEELKKFYEIKEEQENLSIVPMTVIGRDPNENFYGFTADKGTADGVSQGDPVMTDKGLIGWVSEVSPRACKVTTLLSPETKIGAVNKKTSDSGIITGDPILSDEGLTRMINLPSDNMSDVDDIIVTSGYGGVFPKDLMIGVVRETGYDSYTGMPCAVIEPFEDIRNVSSAVIVVNFSGKGSIEADNQESSGSVSKP